MRYAEAAIRRYGAKAHRYYLTAEDTAEAAPKVAAYYCEPFGNSSALPAFYCASQARDAGMTRLLAGDGGDEILAGNRSEEHTSDPVTNAHLVCRLLLEKKKNKQHSKNTKPN